MADEYDHITPAIRALGYDVSRSWCSHVAESLIVSPSEGCSIRDTLRVHKRGNEWFVSVDGPNHFAMPNGGQVLNLCRELLETTGVTKAAPSMTETIKAKYSLIDVSNAKWFAMEDESELRSWKKQGWHPLKEAEEQRLWSLFSARCVFPEGEILEPTPSCTWDVGAIMDQRNENLGMEINRRCHSAFTQCIGTHERMSVLEYRSRSYMLFPHEMTCPELESSWAISILPQGDYHFFLSPDLRFGLLGHVDDTICVFGEELLRLFLTDNSSLFGPPIRNQSTIQIDQ
jgi:hypothetical protein